MKLEHASAYLPYKVQMAFIVREEIVKVGILNNISINNSDIHPIRYSIDTLNELEHEWMFKPILRPLSDLKKEEFNYLYTLLRVHIGKNKRDKLINEGYGITDLPYFIFEQLLENHFDLFNLIKNELAIDKNTL